MDETPLSHPCVNTSPMLDTHKSFEAVGGYYRDEAIMLLRKFYMSENVNGEWDRGRRSQNARGVPRSSQEH